MNQQERVKVGEVWMLTAQTFGKEITRGSLSMMLDAVSDLDSEKVLQGFSNWLRTTKTGRHPYPSEVREFVHPTMNTKEMAITLARKIDATIAKKGWNWELGEMVQGEVYFQGGGKYHWTFKDAVIAELGEIGWHAVCSRGGWINVRNSANEMNEGQFIPQLVGQIEASYNLQKQGIDITLIEMGNKVLEIQDSKLNNLITMKEIPK